MTIYPWSRWTFTNWDRVYDYVIIKICTNYTSIGLHFPRICTWMPLCLCSSCSNLSPSPHHSVLSSPFSWWWVWSAPWRDSCWFLSAMGHSSHLSWNHSPRTHMIPSFPSRTPHNSSHSTPQCFSFSIGLSSTSTLPHILQISPSTTYSYQCCHSYYTFGHCCWWDGYAGCRCFLGRNHPHRTLCSNPHKTIF